MSVAGSATWAPVGSRKRRVIRAGVVALIRAGSASTVSGTVAGRSGGPATVNGRQSAKPPGPEVRTSCHGPAVKAQVAKTLGKPVATRVLTGGTFWKGEAYHQDYAKKNPGSYNAYRIGCGRDRALKAVWGSAAS